MWPTHNKKNSSATYIDTWIENLSFYRTGYNKTEQTTTIRYRNNCESKKKEQILCKEFGVFVINAIFDTFAR